MAVVTATVIAVHQVKPQNSSQAFIVVEATAQEARQLIAKVAITKQLVSKEVANMEATMPPIAIEEVQPPSNDQHWSSSSRMPYQPQPTASAPSSSPLSPVPPISAT